MFLHPCFKCDEDFVHKFHVEEGFLCITLHILEVCSFEHPRLNILVIIASFLKIDKQQEILTCNFLKHFLVIAKVRDPLWKFQTDGGSNDAFNAIFYVTYCPG